MKDIDCSQPAVSKIWCKYKRNAAVNKGKHTSRPEKMSKCQNEELKAICFKMRKCITKQMKNKLIKTGGNVCNETVRKQLNEM